MMTEGIFPAMLHQDPRYFRKGFGSIVSRTGYALSRIVVTDKDGGGEQVDYSEWLGNATAVATSQTYPRNIEPNQLDDRRAGRCGQQAWIAAYYADLQDAKARN